MSGQRWTVAGGAIALVFSLLALRSASAAPSYMIAFNNGGALLPEVSSSTAFRRDTSFALAPSGGAGTLTGGAYAGPGQVRPFARIDCTWEGFGGSFWGKTRARIQTDDFIVSGPAGPSTVSGTLWLSVQFDLAKTGGHSGNSGHFTAFHLNASTPYSSAAGTLTYSNFSLSGSGCFSGVGTTSVDMLVPLTGNYPVNVPFALQIYTEAIPNAYGNWANTPAMLVADGGGSPAYPSSGGIRLVTDGPVMTLPAGYTLNSPGWGIVDNLWPNVVGIADAPGESGVGLELAGSNPAAGTARLRLRLARETEVRVVVHDAAGRAVATLLSERRSAGAHDLTWDGRGASGAPAPAGLYFVRAETDRWRVARRIVRLRP